MDNTFIINPSADLLDIKDELNEKLTAAQAITTCLLLNSCNESRLCDELHNNVLAAIESLLNDIIALFKPLVFKTQEMGE
jgi:hypothetical protein